MMFVNYKLKILLLLITSLIVNITFGQDKFIPLNDNFNKIIVSPHIETIFIKGDVPSITIKNINVPIEKFQYEINSKTLQVYLKGAKTVTKNKKVKYKNYKIKKPIYKNTVVKIVITYADVEIFSLRGEEKINFKNSLSQSKCNLRIYGKSEVTVDMIKVDDLKITIYGESYLNIKKGIIDKQKITAYGSSKIIASNIKSKEIKLTAYGEGSYQFNVSDRIKVSSYGESIITYRGKADLKKGIIIGNTQIITVD
ncbi:GIN domain-containing protein [Tenacibaculum bernardetii]|uniref:GIN domain-containing protein n=1 Tax=Tenacibaculum bernardetii TaxID=3021375 RepID=UPI0023B1DE16|nr:DUF2807 domain-containing protein [Tenacibaculum bernardetii]